MPDDDLGVGIGAAQHRFVPEPARAAQHTAAPSAKATPVGSSWVTSCPSGSSSPSPSTARATHTKSMGLRDDHMATASGPLNSMATATPNGMVCSDW